MFQHLQNVLPRISFSFSLSGLAYFQHLSICFKKMFFTMFQEGKYSMCLCVFFRNYQKVWHKISNNLYLITEWVSLWHMPEWKCSTLKLKKKLFFTIFIFLIFPMVFKILCFLTFMLYCTSLLYLIKHFLRSEMKSFAFMSPPIFLCYPLFWLYLVPL